MSADLYAFADQHGIVRAAAFQYARECVEFESAQSKLYWLVEKNAKFACGEPMPEWLRLDLLRLSNETMRYARTTPFLTVLDKR